VYRVAVMLKCDYCYCCCWNILQLRTEKRTTCLTSQWFWHRSGVTLESYLRVCWAHAPAYELTRRDESRPHLDVT